MMIVQGKVGVYRVTNISKFIAIVTNLDKIGYLVLPDSSVTIELGEYFDKWNEFLTWFDKIETVNDA